jgi:streptogramin lyase
MRGHAFSILLAIGCLFASAARAQPAEAFATGWHVVEKAARYAVLLPTVGDVRASSEAGKAGKQYAMQIGVGEAVVAVARQGDVYFCFESTGRLSAIRGRGALTPANAGGTPALVIKPIEISGRTFQPGSTVWVVSTAPSGDTSTVQLEGGATQALPSASLRPLAATLADHTADKEWARAK